MSSKDWGLILTILTLAAGAVARIVALEQRQDGMVKALADHEGRMRVVELDRSRDQKLEQMQIQLTRIEGEQKAMRAEFAAEARRSRK